MSGGAAGGPVAGVVEVAADRAAGASREPAGAVADPEVAREVGGHSVDRAAVREVGAGLGVGEDPPERGCVGGEPASGLGVDGAVAIEFGGFVAVSEQGEYRHGHVHPRRDHPERRRVPVTEGAAEQQVGRHVELQLRAGVRSVRAGVGEGIDSGHDCGASLGLEVKAEPGHPVLGGFEADPPLVAGPVVACGERFGMESVAELSDSATERGRGLPRSALECGGLEPGGIVRGKPDDGIEQGPGMSEADRPGRERGEGVWVASGDTGVGDQPGCGRLGDAEQGGELGDERAGRELTLDLRRPVVDFGNGTRVAVRAVDQPQLLCLRCTNLPLEHGDPVEIRAQRVLGGGRGGARHASIPSRPTDIRTPAKPALIRQNTSGQLHRTSACGGQVARAAWTPRGGQGEASRVSIRVALRAAPLDDRRRHPAPTPAASPPAPTTARRPRARTRRRCRT